MLRDEERARIDALVRSEPALVELAQRFGDAGFELALVGGPVRDVLMGRAGQDWDLTTSARPEDIERLIAGWADAVWDVGREFGTIALRKGSAHVEITTYRSDEYDLSSRKPQVRFGDSLVGDLSRRDFTVNAMAVLLRTPDGDVRSMRLRRPARRTGGPGVPDVTHAGRRGHFLR